MSALVHIIRFSARESVAHVQQEKQGVALKEKEKEKFA